MVAYSKNPKAADLTAATSNKLASHSLRIRDNRAFIITVTSLTCSFIA